MMKKSASGDRLSDLDGGKELLSKPYRSTRVVTGYIRMQGIPPIRNKKWQMDAYQVILPL